MKQILFVVYAILMMGTAAMSQGIPEDAKKYADDFIKRHGYDEDYSRFTIETNFSYDYGLCYYDPCDYFNEETGTGYDNLTTVHFDPTTGLDYDLIGEYHVNRFIGVGVGIGYFYGHAIDQTRTGGGEGSTYTEDIKLRESLFRVNPFVELSPGWDKINPFVDVGPVFGVFPRVMEKETNTTMYGTSSTETMQSGYYHGGFPIGFEIKAGVDFKVTKVIGLFANFNFIGMNYTPAHYTVNKYTVNGVDEFSTLTTKQKEIDYVKSLDQSENISNDSHNKKLKESFPNTSIGLDIGLIINLGSWHSF